MSVSNKATKFEIFKYSFGGLGSNIAFLLVLFYTMFFYTSVMGINPLAVGALLGVSRLIDAVTDPLMGMISDRTKSKMGRYRPYMIFGAPVLGLLVYLLFSVPNLGPDAKLIYMYVVYISYSIVSTIVNIPYHSLTPVLSEDQDQRTAIVAAKQSMAIPAQLLIGVMLLPILTGLAPKVGPVMAWKYIGGVLGLITTISFWISASSAKKHDICNDEKEHIPFATQLKVIYKNKPLILLLIAFGTDLAAYAVASGVGVFYFTYFVGNAKLFSTTNLIGIIMSLVVYITLPFFAKKLGKKKFYIIGSTLSLLSLMALYFAPSANVGLIMSIIAISALFKAIPATLGWSMVADCVEYGAWKTGIRSAGTVTSTLTFINKLGLSVGGVLLGIVLAKTGFVKGAPEQSLEAVKGIVVAMTIFPIIGYLCSIVAMYFYPITNEFYDKMISDMEIKKTS